MHFILHLFYFTKEQPTSENNKMNAPLQMPQYPTILWDGNDNSTKSNFSAQIINHMPVFDHDYCFAHFAAILQCLHYQTNLAYSQGYKKKYPEWTLNDFRISHGLNHFHHISDYLNNWGFQYFLINFLNNPLNFNITKAITQGMSEVHGIHHLNTFPFYNFLITGADSKQTDFNLLGQVQTSPYSTPYDYHPSRHSDLALIFRHKHDEFTDQDIAIYGEVEGKYGHKLLKTDFWEGSESRKKKNRGKHPDCTFGLGVVKSKTISQNLGFNAKEYLAGSPAITLNYVKVKDSYKIVVLLDQEHSIVQDFRDAMAIIRDILIHGPDYRVISRFLTPLQDACHILVQGLDTPIPQLIAQFSPYTKPQRIIQANFQTGTAGLPQIIRLDS